MKRLLCVLFMLGFSYCFAMQESSTITKWTHAECQRLLASGIEANELATSRIKDANYSLRALMETLCEYQRILAPIRFLSASHSNRFEEFDALYQESRKNLLAVTLLHKQQQRKKAIQAYDQAVRTTAWITAFAVPPSVYFFRQTWWASVPFFLINVGLVKYYRSQRAQMKAVPKPTFSDAVRHSFSYSKGQEHKILEGLKLTLDRQENDIKTRYKKACATRNVGEIVRLAELQDKNLLKSPPNR